MVKYVTLTRPLQVSGQGLPKGGVPVGHEGERVKIVSPNGGTVWLLPYYVPALKRVVNVAVIPSSL